MLTVAKVTQRTASGYAEYLDGKARPSQLGDYYLTDGERTEAPGRWAGGAQMFGLDREQPVTGQQLRALMDVRRPDTEDELRRAGGSGEAVAAIDATFSAPKSVSAVWALARPALRAEIEQAHETAIDRALGYAIGQVAMLRRRVSQDAVIHEKAAGVVATSWRHTTARAVDQHVPDPQLHSHVLLHAAVRRDGRIVAIDSRSWLVHRREVGAAYRTELARELHRLGFAVTRGVGRGGRYFELDAISQPLIDRWSSRHHQVQAAIRERLADQQRELRMTIDAGGPASLEAQRQLEVSRASGQLSPKQDRIAVTATRAAKSPVTVADLDQAWRHTALGLGVSRERIDVLRHQPTPPPSLVALDEMAEALTEFDATFPARDARAVALERSAGAPIETALEQLRSLRTSNEILPLADGTGTTRAHRDREHTVITITQRLTRQRVEPLPPQTVARETDRLDHQLAKSGGRLSDEQRTGIRLACGSQALVVIEGHAGTGKSTTLTGIVRAHQAGGQQILITSTAALAAQRLATEFTHHGVICHASSTAALHAAISTGRITLDPTTTVIHDEAALASTTEQLKLLDAVETSGARLIEVGDPAQNQPVGAGGLWNRIETAARTAQAHLKLTRNQRARDPADQRDQARFREGEIEAAIRGYADRGRVHLHHNHRRAEDQALEAAHTDRTADKSTIVIAQTSNEHLDELNARAQAIRRQHGQLSEHSLPVPGRPYRLYAGDIVQIRRTINHPSTGPCETAPAPTSPTSTPASARSTSPSATTTASPSTTSSSSAQTSDSPTSNTPSPPKATPPTPRTSSPQTTPPAKAPTSPSPEPARPPTSTPPNPTPTPTLSPRSPTASATQSQTCRPSTHHSPTRTRSPPSPTTASSTTQQPQTTTPTPSTARPTPSTTPTETPAQTALSIETLPETDTSSSPPENRTGHSPRHTGLSQSRPHPSTTSRRSVPGNGQTGNQNPAAARTPSRSPTMTPDDGSRDRPA